MNFFQQLAVERSDLHGVRQAVFRYRKIEGEQVIAAESQVHMRDVPQTVNREAAAGQQAECERKFSDHQRASQAMPSGAARRTPPSFSTSFKFMRAARHAGAQPNRTPASITVAKVNSSTGTLMRTSVSESNV